jgi:hypothetical protein
MRRGRRRSCGKWILDNLLGIPPRAAPQRALKDNTVDGSSGARRRAPEHATCAACHNVIDPVGLSLEVRCGRPEALVETAPIDASGAF